MQIKPVKQFDEPDYPKLNIIPAVAKITAAALAVGAVISMSGCGEVTGGKPLPTPDDLAHTTTYETTMGTQPPVPDDIDSNASTAEETQYILKGDPVTVPDDLS